MSAARQKAMQETPAEVVGNDFSVVFKKPVLHPSLASD